MDYRSSYAQILAERDAAIAHCRERLAELKAERDREIRRLRDEGLSYARIGEAVGMGAPGVRLVLSPATRERNARYCRARRRLLKAGLNGQLSDEKCPVNVLDARQSTD